MFPVRKMFMNQGGLGTVEGVPPLTLTRSAGEKLQNYTIYGASGGVGDDQNVIGAFEGVFAPSSYSYNGVSFVKEADGVFLLNGTATSNINISMAKHTISGSDLYTFGGAFGGSSSTYWIASRNGHKSYSEGYVLDASSIGTSLMFGCVKGCVFNNTRIYPVVVKGNTTLSLERRCPPGKCRVPIVSNGVTMNIYLDSPLVVGDSIDYLTQSVTRSDGTSSSLILPDILTAKGTSTVNVPTSTKPSNMRVVYRKG